MSVETKNKSFFATTAGFFTGLAGVLTAFVALIGLAAGQGWIGGEKDSTATPTTVNPTPTTVNPALGGLVTTPTLPGATSPAPATTGPSPITTSPTTVTFDAVGSREVVVRATNGGRTAVASTISVTGTNASNFTATPVDAGCSSLIPGQSCDIKVAFVPKGAGQYSAKLVIQAAGTAREVPLQGSALLS